MISVLIITWKRAALLQKCLDSLVPWCGQTELEVVVLLNGEDAASADVLARMSAQHGWLRWRAIDGLTPGKARNEGIKELIGEWVFFIDDDAQVPPDYWPKWLLYRRQLLGADVIGGPDVAPPGSQGLARAVSLSLSSAFCMGPTAQRHRTTDGEPTPADETILTSCNLWVRRSHFEAGLSFPENYQRTEEVALLQELQKQGAELWHVPDMKVWHARRHSWQALARTSYNSGYYRSVLMQEKSRGPWWFWLPSVFVLLHLLPLLSLKPLLTMMVWWFFPVAAYSWLLCVRARATSLWWQVLCLHWFIPFNYGLGFLVQRFGGRPWRRR